MKRKFELILALFCQFQPFQPGQNAMLHPPVQNEKRSAAVRKSRAVRVEKSGQNNYKTWSRLDAVRHWTRAAKL